jgi:hypothetical protein
MACADCGREVLLVALHGDRGGPDVCLECAKRLLAPLKRKPIERARLAMHPWDEYATEFELDAELLREALSLTHPDRHPPERQARATRVTAALTKLRPYVLTRAPLRNGSVAPPVDAKASADGDRKRVTPIVPICDTCLELFMADSGPTFLKYWCDKCRAWFEESRRQARDRDNARRRARRAERRQREARQCERTGCGRGFTPARSDARYCSNACRQAAHRERRREQAQA